MFAVSALSLAGAIWLLPGLSVTDWEVGLLALITLALLNAVLWPIVLRFAAPLILWTVGLIGLIGNALILLLTADIVDGFEVDGFWWALLAALVMTAISVVLSVVFSIDDDDVWRRNVVRRMVGRLEPPEVTDVPGVLFLQIDGLSEPVLRQAMRDGHASTLAHWVRSGSHRIVRWECDLSSQTGASQAGILHGNNTDMPAFRWYDKSSGRVITTNRPNDAAELEHLHSDGDGLLVGGGASRANVFSGDSADSMFTFSTVKDRSRAGRNGLTYVFSDPYFLARLLVLGVADIGHEIAARRRARRRDVEPRLERRGIYPVLRAATTVMLRDLTVSTLISDIYRGVPVAYVDFVGYDEVAHHSGIAARDALDVLDRLDQQFGRLQRAITEAPRPYHVVVLSDHGQSQGSTFLQRYGMTLGDLVSSLVERDDTVHTPELSSEGWGNLNGALTDSVQSEDSRLAALIGTVVKRRTVDGEVVLGPADRQPDEAAAAADVVVLASGNLGLVSFTDIPGRATVEQLAERYPGLLLGLASHPGIGFALVRSEAFGPMAIGRHGIHYLDDGRIEGDDPLADFGANITHHLRRTDAFTNAPDILVNSFYDPETEEGAAFEELIGFHGGVGGKQTEPFLLFPRGFELPEEPIVGATSVHGVFKHWLAAVAAGDAPAPWDVEHDDEASVHLPSAPVS